MAAKKTARGKKQTTATPPRKPVRQIRLHNRSQDPQEQEFDAEGEGLELGPELGLGAEEWPNDGLEADPIGQDGEPLPPLTARPTRRAKKSTIFPDPGSFKLSWDEGRRYWEQLFNDPRTRSRLRVYVYRWCPAMLEGHRQVVRLEGSASDDRPDLLAKPLTVSEVLHRYGTGDYSFKINDRDAGNQQICRFGLVGRSDMRDWENHPPILDMDGLDLSDPINATYIKE